MSRTRTFTALALTAALASAVPAAATPRTARPHTATPVAAAPGLAQQALAWLAALWGGGAERALTARDASSAALDPNGQTAAYAPSHPIRLPSGGAIDPNG